MARFNAFRQVQMNNLTELALFADTNPGNVKNRSTTGVNVVVDDVAFQIKGSAIEYVFDYPYAGNVTGLGVAIGGPLAYRFTGLTIEMRHLILYLNDEPRVAMQQFLRGNDTVVGSAFDDGLFAYRGDDMIRGGKGSDFIDGGFGNDRLFGDAGADTLRGGPGNDELHGGSGNDSLGGGPGADRFYMDSRLSEAANVERIIDFAPNVDKIVLDKTFFAGLGGGTLAGKFGRGDEATLATQRILYDRTDGYLRHDADGSGDAADPVKFAWVGPNKAIDGGDFILIA
jgi:Ca2+-binding RTX toxin-like protein